MNAGEKKQSLKVFIRQRPFSKNEIKSKSSNIIKKVSQEEICIKSGYTEKKYNFDRVFGEEATQLDVYNAVVSPIINSITLGYNCTVVAYGQTGTGKTHTIVGEAPVNSDVNFHNDLSIGMIPRAAIHLFSSLSKLNPKTEYTVRVSFFEIYNEEVRDLLNESAPLRIYDDPENKGSVYIRELTEVTVCNPQEVYEWLNVGIAARQNAATNANARSSRSHALFVFLVSTREIVASGEEFIKTGKLHLVDLAGSENIGRAGSADVRAREAATINKSLSTLGKVIKALGQKMQHIPYRDSKLTRILQDSFGGGTRTCMIGTISPATSAWDETVSTLDCAQLARSIINNPHQNANKKQSNFLKDLEKEIQKLQDELTAARTGSGFYITSDSYEQMTQSLQTNNEQILELIDRISHLMESKRRKEAQDHDLTESFEQTSAYLEATKQELDAKQQENKENEVILNYALKRDEQLSKTANELLKVCEVSTRHEDIYLSKYLKQCDTTLSNATVAEEVTAVSRDFLVEVRNLSDVHGQKQSDCIKEIHGNAEGLRESSGRAMQQIADVVSGMQSAVNCYTGLSVDDLFKHETVDFNERAIHDYFASLQSLQPKERSKVKEHLEAVKRHILAADVENGKQSKRCLDMIDKGLAEKEKLVSTTKSTLSKLYRIRSERCAHLESQVDKNRKRRAVIMEYLSEIKEENDDLFNESLSIKESIKDLEMLQCVKQQKLKCHIQAAVADYLQFQAGNVEAATSLVDQVVNVISQEHINVENEIVADKHNVVDYVSTLTGTIKKNLTHYNDRVTDMSHNWKEKIMTAKEDWSNIPLANEEVNRLSEAIKDHEVRMQEIIEETSQKVANQKNSIIFTTHVGDTPAKTDYNYPKRIDKALPKQMLLEQLKQIAEEDI